MSSSPLSEDDPLGPPTNTQHLDLSKLSPEELTIFKRYGKLPTTQQILSNKFREKKYFDSGDYAMQKQSGNKNNQMFPGVGVPLRHPNAEKVKEMSNRNSISASNAGFLFNGKSSLLNESTPDKAEQQSEQPNNNQ
ncbi:camp-regulated phosphoprotein/endosulfine conserved region-domain-containing protein [Scheffersomyces coipomensis]|uniref:camp-regulated phosphoprotein/endosulfine conserved region-domain-containing protein n=1 Tax=Scheffersomyces coipomensis TaxID=1788519 RepID=UPI00315D9F96